MVLDLLQIPFYRNEDLRMNELMRLVHGFLQKFCREALLHKHLELYVTPGLLEAQTVCAISQDNAQLYGELGDKVVQHFVHCIETHVQYVPAKDRAGRGLVHPQVPGHVDAGAGQRHRRRPLPA